MTKSVAFGWVLSFLSASFSGVYGGKYPTSEEHSSAL
jgi:hypothetical protein